MNTTLILTTNDKEMIDAINMVSDNWHEMPLPDHPILTQFSRKLIVSGFSNPDLNHPEERIYVYVKQVLTLKPTNEVYKSIDMKPWEIYEWNMEEVIRPDGSVMTGIRQTLDDEGNVINEQEEVVKVPSIQYVRYLIKSKTAHLTDLLARFMLQYVEKFSKEINDI
ncbi:hypothetical protein OK18_19035 [Chryseobacterium gallinarum]|uniref:Uncharacterized protein n=1 Tax=Chryseobacterium gallinarum TaxID=1324352 RepID=A0A0G3MBE9_CHRGL|nr:hypothetical protein [Chryseobacterium gallinarum]AKK74427.1 hypothetical protein OK18_19035 [Chryseobacterium gallinarum]